MKSMDAAMMNEGMNDGAVAMGAMEKMSMMSMMMLIGVGAYAWPAVMIAAMLAAMLTAMG